MRKFVYINELKKTAKILGGETCAIEGRDLRHAYNSNLLCTFVPMKLTDLKDLRVIKKSLEPEQKPQQNQPRKRSVELKSKEEEHARNEGLVMGQKVRMMDTNDTATIIGFGKGYYELDLDGLPIRAVRSEFIPIDADEDRRLRAAIPSRTKKQADVIEIQEDTSADLTVDLHIERIPGNEGVPEWAALDFQMNYFRQILRKNLKHRGRRIVFIHGVGDGTLASALRKELDEVFALSCIYTPGPMGVTNVTIR